MERLLYHGQDSLRSNLDSGKTRSAAYRCSQTRPPTAEPPHGYVAWALTTLFLRSSRHFNTDPTRRTGVLVRRLRSRKQFTSSSLVWPEATNSGIFGRKSRANYA